MSNSDATLITQEIHPIPDTSPRFGLDVYGLAYSDSQNGDPDIADDCKKCQATPAFFNNIFYRGDANPQPWRPMCIKESFDEARVRYKHAFCYSIG
jgi:hypothetical protein